MSDQLRLSILESSQAAEARRAAIELARALDFAETTTGKLAIVTMELATNLVKHASGGQLLLRPIQQADQVGVELLALDKGPGIANLAACLRDGYSTAGSPGTGLGAIERLSTEFEIHSQPELGTAILVRLWRQETAPAAIRPLEIGVVAVPHPAEEVCGDGWWVEQTPDRCLLLVADGLGHGAQAKTAAEAAIRVAQENVSLRPAELMELMHTALRSSRGAAVALAELDLAQAVVRFCGVGNIAGTIIADEAKHNLVSHNGIVGYEIARLQEFTYPWQSNSLLILHSDGLNQRWNLASYQGLSLRPASLLAGVLYRDHARGRDDVTVVVAQAQTS